MTLSDATIQQICLVSGASFFAGLIDAIAGGGGLIQLPALLAVFPNYPIGLLSATNKCASAVGTTVALGQYSRRVSIPWRAFIWPALFAFAGSFCGAMSLIRLPDTEVKLAIMVAVFAVIVLQWRMPQIGRAQDGVAEQPSRKFFLLAIGTGIGFYDGFIGPGTGIFLIFALVACAGYDFLLASASAKIINLATNLAALAYFIPRGYVQWEIALPMACANLIGAFIGSHIAIKKGQLVIKKIFLSIAMLLMARLAWQLFV